VTTSSIQNMIYISGFASNNVPKYYIVHTSTSTRHYSTSTSTSTRHYSTSTSTSNSIHCLFFYSTSASTPAPFLTSTITSATVNSIVLAATYLSSRSSCYITNNTKVGDSDMDMFCKTHSTHQNDRLDRFKIKNDY
jgi:hypothetical protein